MMENNVNYAMWRFQYWNEHGATNYQQIDKAVMEGKLIPGQSSNENRIEKENVVEPAPLDLMREGYYRLNAIDIFTDGKDIIITGIPDCEDESHNCDWMACSTLSHVILRGKVIDCGVALEAEPAKKGGE